MCTFAHLKLAFKHHFALNNEKIFYKFFGLHVYYLADFSSNSLLIELLALVQNIH